MIPPSPKLPKWILEMAHPDYTNNVCCVPCDELPKLIEALTIAYESLWLIRDQHHDVGQMIKTAKEAIAKIEKLGGGR